MTFVVLILSVWNLLFSVVSSSESTNCLSSVRFLKFDPQPTTQLRKGLEFCNKYKLNTCCNSTHAQALKRPILELYAAKFPEQCRRLTEEMHCSSCHPYIGTGRTTRVCPHLCDMWYKACKSEFYASSPTGSLRPCYGNALICSPLNLVANSPSSFCKRMGFEYGDESDIPGKECFDGSVPPEVGTPEPSEPLKDQLFRILEEQAANPSEIYLALVLLCIFSIFGVSKLYSSVMNPLNVPPKLSPEEIRLRRQEFFQENTDNGENLDFSKSVDETGDEARFVEDSSSDSDSD